MEEDLPLLALALRAMAPPAPKAAAFEKEHRSESWPVAVRNPVDAEDEAHVPTTYPRADIRGKEHLERQPRGEPCHCAKAGPEHQLANKPLSVILYSYTHSDSTVRGAPLLLLANGLSLPHKPVTEDCDSARRGDEP